VRGRYRQAGAGARSDTGAVDTAPASPPAEPRRAEPRPAEPRLADPRPIAPGPSRRVAGFLVLAGLWPLLVWPNFVRVVVTDERAFDDGPTAYLLVHVALAAGSMAIGVALVVLGVRSWRRR